MEVMNTADVDVMKLRKLTGETTEHDIEGTVYQKKKGTWFMVVVFDDGRMSTVQVDHCPWCGESLIHNPDYDHEC